MTMPPSSRDFYGTKDKLPMMRVEEGRGCLYTARAAAPSTFSILNKKEVWVKFNKCIIIKSKPMNGNKILVSGRYV
jgi:hypothetical protein